MPSEYTAIKHYYSLHPTDFHDLERFEMRQTNVSGAVSVVLQIELRAKESADFRRLVVMDLLGLIIGLIGFFQSARTKHWSFSATDAVCNIHLDRRKRAMIYLQINVSEGLYPEADVIAAFQQAIVQFSQGEYKIAKMSIVAESLSEMERDIDQEFFRCCQEFLTMQ